LKGRNVSRVKGRNAIQSPWCSARVEEFESAFSRYTCSMLAIGHPDLRFARTILSFTS